MLNPSRHEITIVSDFDEQFSRSVGKLLQNYVVAGDLEVLVSAAETKRVKKTNCFKNVLAWTGL